MSWRRALLVLIALYAAARLALLTSVMTHVDDIGPLVSMLLRSLGGDWLWLWRDLRGWTYPLGPYALQFPLAQLAWDPASALFMARLISLAAWAAGLSYFWGLLEDLARRDPRRWDPWTRVLILAWALLSWRGIIESSQAYHYAWSFLAVALYLRFFLLRLGPGAGGLADRGASQGWVLGASILISYQTPPLAAAVFGALALHRWRNRDWAALRQDAWAAAMHAPFYILAWRLHLRHLQMRPGHPPWAWGYPDRALPWWEGLAQLAQGAGQAWSSLLSVGPWGAASTTVAVLAAVAAALGLWRSRSEAQTWRVPALSLAVAVTAVWAVAAWRQSFPFGPTRHTFVLQAPLLLGLGAALGGWPRAFKASALAGLLLLFAWNLPRLDAGLRGHIDLERVEALLQQDPRLKAGIGSGGYTRDHMLLLASHPDWAERLRMDLIPGLVKLAPSPLLILDHRVPLSAEDRGLLLGAGYQVQALEERPPLGSTELVGDLNGGNGAYLYLALPKTEGKR